MNIAGVIVHVRPEDSEPVKERLAMLPGVEVHAVTDEGKMVVTVEEDDDCSMSENVMKLQNIDGVVSAAMIYHHSECEPSEQEASQ